MKIQLIDKSQPMVDAWKREFQPYPEIEVICGSAFDYPTDCIISPANSFLYMDGGFDGVITKTLGKQVQINAQKKLREEYNGELLVGQAFFFETGSKLVPYCIAASTMRVPLYLGPTSVNAYLASRAIFLLLKNSMLPFTSVTIPGLGTGVGKVPYENCAHQMRVAYDEFYLDQWKEPTGWYPAQIHHQKLFRFKTNTYTDLQFDQSIAGNGAPSNSNDIISDDEIKNLGF